MSDSKTPWTVARVAGNTVCFQVGPHPLLAHKWLQRFLEALKAKCGSINKDFRWDVTDQDDISVVLKVTNYTDKITRDKFVKLIQEVAPFVLLPKLLMEVIGSPGTRNFIIEYGSEVGTPLWPQTLQDNFAIEIDTAGRRVTFEERNRLHRDVTQEDIDTAKVALQQAIKG